jgi:acetate kinase
MRVLVVNAGSSSVKLSLLGDGESPLAARELAAPQARIDPGQLDAALGDGLADAEAVGHRIVHGGEQFRGPVIIDRSVEHELRALTELAPLHQPKSLAAYDTVSRALPALPHVACFDTAYHATIPPAAATYAIPAGWRERWALRRFGFHGLSHAWIARRVIELAGTPVHRIVSCHLGAGASLAAIADGRSIDTTMGFTPLEGLVMATRSGSVDPGLLLWLLGREEATSPGQLAIALEHESGLQGLAGTSEMPEVIDRAAQGDERARLALGVYVHRLGGGIATMTASLGGLDVLAFTGGVGEHAPPIRARAAAGLRHLGVELDEQRNRDARADVEIGRPGCPVRTFVIAAREDLEIAAQTRALLASG